MFELLLITLINTRKTGNSMKTLLISYTISTIMLISVHSLVFDISVSTIPRTLFYLSLPILIAMDWK